MKRATINQLLLLSIVVLLFSSCEKWRNNREFITTIDNEVAASTYTDLFGLALRQVYDYGDDLTGNGSIPDDCYTVSIGSTFPKTVMLDFGTENCDGLYEITRRGILRITYSDPFNTVGATATVVPDNFYVDNFLVEGNLVLTVQGIDQFAFKVVEATVTSSTTDDVVLWNADWLLQRSDAGISPFPVDDVYSITGTTSGTNREGNTFNAEIKETLEKATNCRWPILGEYKLSIEDLKDRNVKFGNEACDNFVKVTRNGKKKENEVNLK